MTNHDALEFIDQEAKREFDSNKRILAFEEYLAVLAENPKKHLRGSAQYLVDMMDHFGKEPIQPVGTTTNQPATTYRFKIFDLPVEGLSPKVVGQEYVQTQIYRALKTFSRQRGNNKLVLLHGPNGSAKTSLVHAMMGGLERYSHVPEGVVYTFNWVFPIERYTKGGIGINTYTAEKEPLTSYAKLPEDEIAVRIPCDMKDHPLLMVPEEQRRAFLEKMVGPKKAAEIWETLPNYISKGELCHRCKQIYDAVLVANRGDFRKVAMHMQVERFYFAQRYRKGLVTIEPQMHVDAQYHQLTYNKSMSSLPATLQGLNLFALTGDLIDGNRGIIEYSDLLKRPVDSFKYLLGACETGSVNIGSAIAYMDAVMLGSTNELQLDAFKEFPDFTSFKARIELIRVPYLLSVSQEEEIYNLQLSQFSGEKHSAPHVAWTAALWAVLTRLKKPNSINFPPNVSTLVSNLTPIEKARLYDKGDMPASLSPEERKLLRSNVRRLKEEYLNVPYYEGRMGASAREIKSILYDAAQNPEFACLSPLAVMREMEEFVKRVTEYEFLKQDIKDGFHDSVEFVNLARTEYLNKIDREVRDSIGLYDSTQWEDFLKKYVQHISILLKKEKIKNPITGKLEDPDFALVSEFEKIVEAPGYANRDTAKDSEELNSFRQNILSQLGAWTLDHPRETISYASVFPEFWRKMEKHYYESQKSVLTKMHDVLLVYGKDEHSAGGESEQEGSQLARKTVENMKAKLGYCDLCAREVITFLLRQRY